MTQHKKTVDTWRRILDCAEDLFAERGYDGASTRDIARRADISVNTLQYHCGGKRNLYNKVLERALLSVNDQLVNKRIVEILDNDLTDTGMLEESIIKLIDDLFDILSRHPNYARLFFRQWLVSDPDLRVAEWDGLIPTVQTWSQKIESQVGRERLGGLNLFLFFLSASLIYWGLMVQPGFIAKYFDIKPDSEDLLTVLKDHAKEVTLRMIQRRQSRLP